MNGALLIGGAGFLGRNLADAFEDAGSATWVLDPAVREPGARRIRAGLAQTDVVGRLLEDDAVEVVVHLASNLLPASDERDYPREQADVVEPSLDLIARCARLRKRFVLFSSGGTVYGDGDAMPIGEHRSLAPRSRYGRSKVLLEEAVREAHARDGLEYLILRPSNPYGRHQRLDAPQGLIAVAIGRALSGRPLEIWGDGSAVRDYVDVRDLATAVVGLVRTNAFDRTLNLSSGVGHSVDAVLATIERALGLSIERLYRPPRSSDMRSVILDPSMLARLVAWAPRSLEQGIAEFCEEIRPRSHA